MDFFQSQDSARHNTSMLLVLFVLAVASMIIFTNFLVMYSLGYFEGQAVFSRSFDWDIFLKVGAGVLALVVMGSLYKVMALAGGGAQIAEMMGGELIVNDSGDKYKQRVLNVVEEMAIAAGVPVPPVYLINEEAINAFAAGYSPNDAVIGVTRGAIRVLSRDGLQGVIAHEFSHILNGDMRLNIRLIGLLHGILLIGLVGYQILRFTSRSRNSKGSGGIMLLGLGMIVIGYTGTFFGNLIKAAVSRQREYLADAAAVQFTRNPEGIGRALIRIGAPNRKTVLDSPNSAEISHFFFCQGISSYFTSFFATHPSLDKRIRRILPTWDGKYATKRQPSPPSAEPKSTGKNYLDRPGKKKMAIMAAGAAALTRETVVKKVGKPGPAHLGYAHQLIKDLPVDLKNAAHDPYEAQALIYSLVLDKDETEQQKQLNYLKSAADIGIYTEVNKLAAELNMLQIEHRLPLIDMAMVALRQLSAPQYQSFKKNLNGLILADNKIKLFEWSLQKIVFHRLDEVFEKKTRTQHKTPSLKRTKEAITILLSLFATALKQDGVSRQEAFEAAEKEIGWLDTSLLAHKTFKLKDLDLALNDLANLKPGFKATLLKACAAIVTADKHVSASETELLRAIADTLDCPIPPLVS